MNDSVTITTRGAVTVHSWAGPAEGLSANTQFIELPTEIVAIDAQFDEAFARDALAYATSLGKPITRLYISHAHPDHFLGAAAFAAPVYALASLKADAAAIGRDAPAPDYVVSPGEEIIDGVRFDFQIVTDTEASEALVVGLPDHGILIAGDVLYNRYHLYIADGHLEQWARVIGQLAAEPYDVIVPGHGEPAGVELYDEVTEYLTFAKTALATAEDGAALKSALVNRFPDHRGVGLIDIQNGYIFPG
jgi:glyoxylase-like metal-dependent hydrolase (beta-lactamase superfamily II)